MVDGNTDQMLLGDVVEYVGAFIRRDLQPQVFGKLSDMLNAANIDDEVVLEMKLQHLTSACSSVTRVPSALTTCSMNM